MADSYKEQLSKFVEKVFKRYTSSGLHICDLATGGGKSHAIGKLTCEYYPQTFDRIIILCVQTKLLKEMNDMINLFINERTSLIKAEQLLLIKNNADVLNDSITNGNFRRLIEQIQHKVGEMSAKENVNELRYACNRIMKTYDGVKNLITSQEKGKNKNDFIQNQITDGEQRLRNCVRSFFDLYKRHIAHKMKPNRISIDKVLKEFPALVDVYPQVDYKRKKVLLMTVHKAMYGIDPILGENVSLHNITEKGKKTLILFDESDQAAIAIRNVIIEQSINDSGGYKRFAKGYNGYLQYKQLTDMAEHVSDEYYGNHLNNSLKKANKIISTNWKKILGATEPYKNIFLGDIEDLENYRRGVFFSGPAMKLNVSKASDKTHSFLCYHKGDKQFKLHHAQDDIELKKSYDYVVPMDKFLSMIVGNTTAIKAQLSKVVNEAFKKSVEEFEKNIDALAANELPKNHFLGYPTWEREIHTLFSRFETDSEYQFEQQLFEFMTNRKNLIVNKGDKTLKFPDNSVYSQGVQLFQEEVDERDNQHRVRLSCREISTTPEKIIIDLLRTEGSSVVLSSATASNSSVISNYDIKYLKETLGDKVYVLSEQDRRIFDDLVAHTYPQEHKVEVIPLQRYYYEDNRDEKVYLPEKYKRQFSKEAQDEGLVDLWFKCTRRELVKNKKDGESISFEFYRLFQFIEAYSWFIKYNDVRSMLFFQNRIGDTVQTNVISCLIDGSYRNQKSKFEDEIPTDWKNEHIRITNDWEEVESSILDELSKSKDAKIMLVSAYASFKAGANMQYYIPKGVDFVQGDNWEKEGERLKKDWDAVYLQCPSAYLMMTEDGNESTYEKSLYNVMLSLMMLYERGYLNRNEVASWLCRALSNNFWFGDKNNPGIGKDKAAWAQTIVEQAVGRLCRTRNKPHTTYILFDMDMAKYFDKDNLEKSLTKEFKALVDYIVNIPEKKQTIANSPEEIIRCNCANYADRQLNRMRSIALRYTPHPNQEEYLEDDDDGVSVSDNVQINQLMNQSYKQTIIKKPVIDSYDELVNEDKYLPFIYKCYGDWPRNESNEYFYSYDPNRRNEVCPQVKGIPYPKPMSPKTVRLDVLMKNKVIRQYFEANGYAIDWKNGGMILHPEILKTDYAGEIGEEAFKAIVLHYTNCSEDNIRHLEGRNYELADFVICNSDGTYKIAFDVKNMNPEVEHDDKQRDLPTKDKRKIKCERLGCQLITVSMLQLPGEPMDGITEIHGLIDNNGNIIPNAIETLKRLIG